MLINSIQQKTKSKYPKFGVNKVQTMTRLVYEIAKRDHISEEEVLNSIPRHLIKFDQIKACLLKQRYPNCSKDEISQVKIFPSLDLDPALAVDLNRTKLKIKPQEFLIEKAVKDSRLAKRVSQLFPHTPVHLIDSYNSHIKKNQFSITNYNHRLNQIFVVQEKFNYITPCPCTKDCVCCGYTILNCGTGCGFECEYCFLQSYTNAPGIVIPANIEDYLQKIGEITNPTRIGTGQFTDSLIFDHITEYSKEIIPFVRNKPHIQFEFKTKSNNITNLLSIPAAENVVAAWSINPPRLIDQCEHFTASLQERLTAAKQCQDHGYKVAFHFDPIIYFDKWKEEYTQVIDDIFTSVKAEKIAWISLGTLRMTLKQKQTIESRFPQNTILDQEFICGFDDKLRYNNVLRAELYQTLLDKIHQHSKQVHVYLCMEDQAMHKKCNCDNVTV
ncbi:MAG: hypothetical protein HQL26_09830 [Candidatus Omnitrophica bacterium]|nr:hypothetical protein [Candidatus Omnitrophota bacterium]